MPRVKGGYVTRQRRNRTLKLAKGYFGSKHALYRTAHEQVMHSMRYAFRDRRQLKREMRKLWIARINAAAKNNDMNYSTLMHGLKLEGINLNRKMLSEIAIHDPEGFKKLAQTAKEAISAHKTAVAIAIPDSTYTVTGHEKAEAKPKKAKAAAEPVEAEVAQAEPVKKPAAKKATVKKVAADAKPAAEKPVAKKATAVKKAPAKKPAAKKAAVKE